MIGEITRFDDATQEGVITDDRGAEYVFDLVGWRGRGLPGPGLAVDFEARDGRASQVFNARVKQQKARRAVSMPPERELGEVPPSSVGAGKQPSGRREWPMGRVITGLAMAGLVLAGLWFWH
ncbi:hypothetical protein Q4589_08945 [Cobetia marina]|uniref:hypothetical protein n=1 Tax=Cobetia marina TaxID=28258 RepID=UPI0026E265DA|nr:hypothetical protein [Cobetia marina]MDO6787713.1 hypothetical protein [Cobetia marina]